MTTLHIKIDETVAEAIERFEIDPDAADPRTT